MFRDKPFRAIEVLNGLVEVGEELNGQTSVVLCFDHNFIESIFGNSF